jgi:hypothetical protein
MGSGLANELDLTFGDFARGDADAAQQHLGRLKPLQSATASDAIPLKMTLALCNSATCRQ